MTTNPIEKYTCPITQLAFTDPVIASDGYLYERSAIKKWFEDHDTSPLTGLKIPNTLITNHVLRSEMLEAGYKMKSLIQTHDNLTSHKITLVIDISGSMATSVENKNTNEPSFSRMDLLKHSIVTIAHMMGSNDQLSIVTFSTTASVVMPWTKMNNNGIKCAEKISQNIYPTNSTNILAGIEVGVNLNADHIILLTDGANSIESYGRRTLADHIIDKISGYSGIIHTVGFGMSSDLDTTTLRKISSNKKGLYCFCPDASMVGTIFTHLMANIFVNEPGIPFAEHTKFVEMLRNIIDVLNENNRSTDDALLAIAEKYKFDDPILREEIVSDNPNKGQITRAMLNWNTWGRHYLPSFTDAHIQCMTTNFKDASLQGYATPNVRKFIDSGEEIFLKITPPVPSCNNESNTNYSSVVFTQTTMNSNGVCFGPNTIIKTFDPKTDTWSNTKIKNIRKGMYLSSIKGLTEVLCLVISPATEMVNVGFWVSKKHPIRLGGQKDWKYAESFAQTTEQHECYNLVLESGHVIYVGNYEAVTLGHCLKQDLVEHEYLGSEKIVNDLRQATGWSTGIVNLKGLKRDESGYICGIIIDE